MNWKIPVAMAFGVLAFAGAFTYGFYSGVNVAQSLEVTGLVEVMVLRDGKVVYYEENHNLVTTAGKDFISAQLGSTAPGTNGANYIALTTDAIAPAAGDTTLTGEIATGGLTRALGTYAHTGGTNTYTVSKQFTASASFTAVQKAGLFTAATLGTMMAENTFSSVNLISGDQITITWTITIS